MYDIRGTIREYSYIQCSRNIIWKYSLEFHREHFPNILGINHGNVPRIFHKQYSRNIIWEYSPEFHREVFPSILGIYHGNVPRIFHEHIFPRWDKLWKLSFHQQQFSKTHYCVLNPWRKSHWKTVYVKLTQKLFWFEKISKLLPIRKH